MSTTCVLQLVPATCVRQLVFNSLSCSLFLQLVSEAWALQLVCVLQLLCQSACVLPLVLATCVTALRCGPTCEALSSSSLLNLPLYADILV